MWHLPDSTHWFAHLARVVFGAQESKMNIFISFAEGCSIPKVCARVLALGLQRGPIARMRKTVSGKMGQCYPLLGDTLLLCR